MKRRRFSTRALYSPGQPILDSNYYADYDLDSYVTILDATGIQRYLVGLPNSIG